MGQEEPLMDSPFSCILPWNSQDRQHSIVHITKEHIIQKSLHSKYWNTTFLNFIFFKQVYKMLS